MKSALSLITFLIQTGARNRRQFRPRQRITLAVQNPSGETAVTIRFGAR